MRLPAILAAGTIVIGLACAIPGIAQALSLRGERAEVRYAPLHAALQGVREAGYLTDEDLGHDAGALRFHRAAYALAPVLVRPDTRERLLVVDLARPARLDRLLQAPGLRLVSSFGDGLALVEQR